jgi:type IV pilus assembly protein PilA
VFDSSLEIDSMKDRQAGFSLIELLVVVAIILIIAAIAIPNFLRAKISANESSAVSSVHSINTSEISYSSMFGSIGYSVALSDLGSGGVSPCPNSATASCFIDMVLATGTKSGYKFSYAQNGALTPSLGFTINADPQISHITGERGFYSDESNVIRFNTGGPANSGSPPL